MLMAVSVSVEPGFGGVRGASAGVRGACAGVRVACPNRACWWPCRFPWNRDSA